MNLQNLNRDAAKFARDLANYVKEGQPPTKGLTLKLSALSSGHAQLARAFDKIINEETAGSNGTTEEVIE